VTSLLLRPGLLHPLDTLKTIRQADGSKFGNAVTAARALVARHGIGGLYRGVLPAVVGAMPSSALYFGAYEFVKDRLGRYHDGQGPLRILTHATAAASGNIASSMIFVPKEVLKQRAQVAGTGLSAALRGVLKERGVAGLYAGFSAVLWRNVPSAVIRFVTFEELKAAFDLKPEASKTPALLAAGALAGGISSFCTTPLDVVKTRFATGLLSKDVSVVRALTTIGSREGVRALWAGCMPRVVMSAMFTGVGFSAFEFFKAKLKTEPLEAERSAGKP